MTFDLSGGNSHSVSTKLISTLYARMYMLTMNRPPGSISHLLCSHYAVYQRAIWCLSGEDAVHHSANDFQLPTRMWSVWYGSTRCDWLSTCVSQAGKCANVFNQMAPRLSLGILTRAATRFPPFWRQFSETLRRPYVLWWLGESNIERTNREFDFK